METTQVKPQERIIRPQKGFAAINFRELWQYRELFWFLAWRDIMIRYKQSVLGIGWAVIEPIMIMVVFTVIFGKVAQLPSDGVPYPLLTFAAVLPWNLFSKTLAQSSNSLVTNAQMISKVYFPRLIVPAGSIIAGSVDFAVTLAILIVMMIWYGVWPSAAVVFLPLFFLLAVMTSFGVGLWLSALNVIYRDVRHLIPFIVRLGLYVSPVGFSSSVVPEQYKLLYSLNPLVGVIDGFRWCLLGSDVALYWPGLYISVFISFSLVISGAIYFRKAERTFADVI